MWENISSLTPSIQGKLFRSTVRELYYPWISGYPVKTNICWLYCLASSEMPHLLSWENPRIWTHVFSMFFHCFPFLVPFDDHIVYSVYSFWGWKMTLGPLLNHVFLRKFWLTKGLGIYGDITIPYLSIFGFPHISPFFLVTWICTHVVSGL